MASGKTLDLIEFSRSFLYRGKVRGMNIRSRSGRDRSLNGKARIKARKARNKRGW